MCIWRGFITKNTIKEFCMCKYWRANHYVNLEALSCPSKGSGRSWLNQLLLCWRMMASCSCVTECVLYIMLMSDILLFVNIPTSQQLLSDV